MSSSLVKCCCIETMSAFGISFNWLWHQTWISRLPFERVTARSFWSWYHLKLLGGDQSANPTSTTVKKMNWKASDILRARTTSNSQTIKAAIPPRKCLATFARVILWWKFFSMKSPFTQRQSSMVLFMFSCSVSKSPLKKCSSVRTWTGCQSSCSSKKAHFQPELGRIGTHLCSRGQSLTGRLFSFLIAITSRLLGSVSLNQCAIINWIMLPGSAACRALYSLSSLS